jgi:hypothetical protein
MAKRLSKSPCKVFGLRLEFRSKVVAKRFLFDTIPPLLNLFAE